MIGSNEYRIFAFANFCIQVSKESRQVPVQPQIGIFCFNGIRAKLVPNIIRRRKAYC